MLGGRFAATRGRKDKRWKGKTARGTWNVGPCRCSDGLTFSSCIMSNAISCRPCIRCVFLMILCMSAYVVLYSLFCFFFKFFYACAAREELCFQPVRPSTRAYTHVRPGGSILRPACRRLLVLTDFCSRDAMLARDTSHGRVSVCLCLSVCHKSAFYRNS